MVDGRYIYCITEVDGLRKLGVAGIFDSHVFSVSHKDIGALVSKIPFEELKPDMGTIEAHQRVVEFSRKNASTLPVKFGVIMKTEEGVKTLLSKFYKDYRSKLTKFKNKDEFGLMVLKLDRASTQETSLPTKKTENRKRIGEGQLYFQRLREEEASKTNQLKKWDKIGVEIQQELLKYAEQQSILNSNLPRVLLNASFLVDRKKTFEFTSSVENIRLHYEKEGVAIHLSGPWAPYSFC